MAQLNAWFNVGWVGNMAPGQVHGWAASGGGLQVGDVIEIMAHPVVGNPNAPQRVLRVENIQAQGTPNGSRSIFFDIRNTGSTFIVGYNMSGMMLRP
jgi:hypothetical protein